MSEEKIRCIREGCHPEDGGDCIEGLSVAECPHRHSFALPQDDAEASHEKPIEHTAAGTFRVHNGEGFTQGEADAFLRKQAAVVVAFIGCPDAGKTTAAVMIYELLKRRRLPKFGFAGSHTIRGFQMRSFKSLLASGLDEPVTERTSGSVPPEFLHLRLCVDMKENKFFDVLLSDRTGEDFEACMGKPQLCATYAEIPRANCHVVLVDGSKLVNDDLAELHVVEVRRIFISLIKTPLRKMQLVLTKYDNVLNSTNKDSATKKFDDLFHEFKRRTENKLEITSHMLAARPSRDTRDEDLLGHGLEILMSEWFSSEIMVSEFRKELPTIVAERPYDSLLNMLRAGDRETS